MPTVRSVSRQALRAADRRPSVEGALALVAALVLACVSHVHTVLHLRSTVPQDLVDPLLQTWQLAWDGHVVTDPGNIFDANAFYPLDGSLSFTDSLFGYFPFGLVGSGPGAAVLRYNVVFLLAWALAGAAAYVLARQLGLRRGGAAVAGLALEFAPWRVQQSGHLNILSCGFYVLALAFLARGHDIRWSRGRVPRGSTAQVRPRCVVAGWALLAWQVSLGFGVGLQAVYVVVGLGVVLLVRAVATGRARVVDATVWSAGLLGLGGFMLVAGFMARPYLATVAAHPESRRALGDVDLYSPPWYGFLTDSDQSALFGGSHLRAVRDSLPNQSETVFGLGLVVVTLAVAGLVLGGRGLRPWSRRRRLGLLGFVLGLLVLAAGTTVGGAHSPYALLLFDHAPGWQGVRTPGRIAISADVGLVVLAGLGAEQLGDVLGAWAGAVDVARARVALCAAVAVLVLAEGWNTTGAVTPRPTLSALRVQSGPTLVLPSDEGGDATVMLWSTATFVPTVNGSAGFVPRLTDTLRKQTEDFPSAASVAALQAVGVHRVVVDVARAAGTPLGDRAQRDYPELGLTREAAPDSVVYVLP